MAPSAGRGDVPEIQEARTRIVESILGTLMVVSASVGLLLVVLSPTARLRQVVLATAVFLLSWGIRQSVRRAGYRIAGWAFIGSFLLLFGAAAWTAGGVLAPATQAFLVLVVLAALLLGSRAGYVTAGLVAVLAFAYALAQERDLLPAPWVQHTAWSRGWLVAIYAGILSVFLGVAMRILEEALAYAGHEIRTRKQAEADLQAAQAGLEQKVAARTEELARTIEALEGQTRILIAAREAQARFLALVSHELRTPLTSVRASLGLLAARTDLPAEARPLAEIADRNSIRLLNLTNELLDLEKAGAGLFRVRQEPLDLREPVRQAFEAFRSLAEERRIPCALALPETEVRITGDGARLEQVCLNLLSNALKHAKGDGAVELRLEARAEGAWVGVTNPGDPIPDSFQERIFHTFHQLEPEAGTSGLGLSLSKAIVEAHGGRIAFESGPGRTTFFFLLPRG
ncbi:MAG TPA: HAMP domain-containing sensor histidine kinase [Holophagaceae bacterium]|nr:HAMP domain-containing sensor histidine kinase [Holophagaceae bacterium]